MREFAVIEAPVQGLEQEGPVWVEAMVAKNYETKQYGTVPVTVETLDRFVKNFKNNVRGQEIAVDFEHGYDPTKGKQASGWFKDFDIRPSSADPKLPALFAQVEFTDDAKKEIKDKKWRYFSLEWEDQWEDNDGNLHPDVITGGALTNRPVAKHMLPINFSEAMEEELTDEEKKRFAVWTTKYINSLPDSAFLYVEAGADQNKEKRHLPYKDSSGKIDLPHLRNAIARIPQMSGISQELKDRLQSKARSILARTQKAMSEGVALLSANDSSTLVEGDLANGKYEIIDETKEWEHSEPGTGTPPQPRTDEDGSDDPSIGGGWRRETPPPSPLPDPEDKYGWSELPKNTPPTPRKEATKLSVYEFSEKDGQELLRVLDLPVDAEPAKVLDSVKIAMGELSTFKEAENKEEQEKKFAEQYPLVWKEHVELMETNRTNAAHKFSETVTKVRKMEGKGALKTTGMELSKVALDKIEEVHRKFADSGDEELVVAYEEVVKAITQGGIIQFGEIGTTSDGEDDLGDYDGNTAAGVAGARKAFAELMSRAKAENPELTDDQALSQVAQKHPDLFSAARQTVTA